VIGDALNHLLDDGLEETVLFLETGFIFLKELVKVMEEQPVELGALRMPRAVNSCHNRSNPSRNRPDHNKSPVSSYPLWRSQGKNPHLSFR